MAIHKDNLGFRTFIQIFVIALGTERQPRNRETVEY